MRIASLSPAATEILFALGLGDQIVCTDQFSNFPEEVAEIPHVKDHAKVRAEDLEEHEPDVVFTGTVVQEWLTGELQKAGFSVVHQDPRTLVSIYESIRELGIMFSVEQKSEDLIAQMQHGFADIRKKAGKLPKRVRLYVEEWHMPPMASGNWVPEVAQIAGCQQCLLQPGELSRAVEYSAVHTFDPDLMVVSWCGAGSLVDIALVTGREGWGDLRCVREGAIRVIDDSLLNRPGPRLVEGAQRLYSWVFEMLH